MDDPQNALTLTVEGMDYGGWTRAEISAGFEQQARSFSLGITWQWPGQASSLRIAAGDRCELRIGNDRVLTGWVSATPVSYDDHQTALQVQGESLTVDLVECSAINRPGQWRKQNLVQIASALAAPYGVQVVSELGTTRPVESHAIEPGETVFKSLDRLLTLMLAYSTDDAYGRLVLARPGSGGDAFDTLEVGRNVLSGSSPLSFQQRYSEYRVYGQRKGKDDEPAEKASEVQAAAFDPAMRKRVLLINDGKQTDHDAAQQRADWERRSREAATWEATYKVQGWRQSNGALWRQNTSVWVRDPIIGIERQMLISKVTYALTAQGSVTTLQVAPAARFELNPTDPKRP